MGEVIELSDYLPAPPRSTITVVMECGLAAGARVLDALGCETIEGRWLGHDRTRLEALADDAALSRVRGAELLGAGLRVERVEVPQ